MLEGECPLTGSSTGWLGVGLGLLAAVRRDVALDLPLELLDTLLQAGVFFDMQLDLDR